MEESQKPRGLIYVCSAQKNLDEFPLEVREIIAYAMYLAQNGRKHQHAKPLTGDKAFSGASVLEVVEDYRGDTYRAVYTVRFKEAVYVLHVFQKKSTHGIKTPKREIDLVKKRFKDAQAIHEEYVRREVQR